MVDLDDELNEVAGHLNAQHARLASITAELLEDPGKWASEGIWTVQRYLAWRTGVSPKVAGQVADIARRHGELPVCMGAFGRGELSLDQVTVIVRHAPAWADAEVTELAKMLTVAQLRRSVGRYVFPIVTDPDDDPAPVSVSDDADAGELVVGPPVPDDHVTPVAPPKKSGCCGDEERSDRCWFGVDDDGRFRLHLDCDQLAGMIIERALEEARDALFHNGQADVNWVDALLEIANRSLDAIASPTRRNRFRINMNLNTHGRATDAAGYHLPDAIRRYITCDGMITPVLVDNGIPVSVGRSQHIIPDRTRRVVEHRDGGCRVPGCTTRHFLEVHHIIHWDHDGPSDTWNLICLCPHHHRLHHQGKLAITGNADVPGGVTFTDAAGNALTSSGARPTPPGAPPPTMGRYEHPWGERLQTKWLTFNPPAHHRAKTAAQIRRMSPNYDN